MNDRNLKLIYIALGSLMLILLQSDVFQLAISLINILPIPYLTETIYWLMRILSFVGVVIFIIISLKLILNNIKKINLDNDFKNLSFIFTIHLVSLILIRVFSIYIFGFESYENNFMIQVLLNIAFIIYEMYMVSKLMSKLKNNITIKKRSSRIKKSPISGRVIDIEQYKNMNK